MAGGEQGVKVGVGVGTGQGDDSAALTVCHFLESTGRAPLRDIVKACATDTLNVD